MNTKTFFVAAAAAFGAITSLGASSAFASESIFEYPTAYTTSSVSRAEVKAEALRARAAGQITQGEQTVVVADTGLMLSRAQVRAETLAAIRAGAISIHEQSYVPTQAQLDIIRMAGQKAAAVTMASL